MKGRVAILAGGTGALGQSVTMRFLAEGAVACVPFAVPAERDALSNRIEPAVRTRLHFTEADVTDEASFGAFAKGVLDTHGRIDVSSRGGRLRRGVSSRPRSPVEPLMTLNPLPVIGCAPCSPR